MSTGVVCKLRIRGAQWNGIGQKLRDCAVSDDNDLNEWCMSRAKEAWSRGDEAYAIAKEIERSDNE